MKKELLFFRSNSNKYWLICLAFLLVGILPVIAQTSSSEIHWDLNNCDTNSNNFAVLDFSEFTATKNGNSSCSSVTATNIYRNTGAHSCTTDRNGNKSAAACVTMPDNNYERGSSSAVRFSVTVDPVNSYQMNSLSFYETAPERFLYSSADPTYASQEGVNNYPTRFAIRVLKDGVQVFEQKDLSTERAWNLRSFDFSSNPAFKVTSTSTFEFELIAYAPIGNGKNVYAWDLDDLNVQGTCNSTPLVEICNDGIDNDNDGQIDENCETNTGSIGDMIWKDADSDGIMDAGESGAPGVKVVLFTCAGKWKGTKTTDSNGKYKFSGLAAGSYKIKVENLPSGYEITKKDATANNNDSDLNSNKYSDCVTLGSGQSITNLDGGLKPSGGGGGGTGETGSIGDMIWKDADSDGIMDAGESGASGVKVVLFTCAGKWKGTKTTDSNGKYKFSGLAAGSYKIKVENLPSGYEITKKDATGDNNDSDLNSNRVSDCVTLGSGQNITNLDGGLKPSGGGGGGTGETGSIGDMVWKDNNGNGIMDAGEPGVSGVKVVLFTCAGNWKGNKTTDSNGKYNFSGLAAGSYKIKLENLPSGYEITKKDATGDNNDSDLNSNRVSDCVTLGSGQSITNLDGGLKPSGGGGGGGGGGTGETGSIGDMIWKDSDSDGIMDAGESGVSGVKVVLFTCAGNWKGTKTTDSNGKYKFSGLAAGSYKIKLENLPSGYEITKKDATGDNNDSDLNSNRVSDCVTLGSGQSITNLDGGLKPSGGGGGGGTGETGSIGDMIWKDSDSDGIMDAGESGVSGVKVVLFTCAGNWKGTKTTDSDGKYKFSGLAAGSYKIKLENLPSGYEITKKDATGDNNDSDLNSNRVSDCVTLGSGQNITNLDGGLKPSGGGGGGTGETGSIGDMVWKDNNGNGIMDAGEPGVSGVKVVLFTCAGNWKGNKTTDSNGKYNFSGLAAGSYKIKLENLPSGYEITKKDATGDNNDSDLNSNRVSDCVTLGSGQSITNLDGGLKPSGGGTGETGSIGDMIWKDIDKDGIMDAGEPGVSGVKVVLFTCGGQWKGTKTTDSNGKYKFSNLTAGSYKIKVENLPSGYEITKKNATGDNNDSDLNSNKVSDCVTLGSGQNITNLDGGLVAPTTPPNNTAKIGDKVWNDTNKNGIQDAGEAGVGGVRVTLFTCNGTYVDAKTTNSNGNYIFDQLSAGSYQVRISNIPNGYVFTSKDQGNETTDSDFNSSGTSDCIELIAGAQNLTIDAGIYGSQTNESSDLMILWDLDLCKLTGDTFSEFTSQVSGASSCSQITTENVHRPDTDLNHSCTNGVDGRQGTAMCLYMPTKNYVRGSAERVVFSFTVSPKDNFKLKELSFYEMAPVQYISAAFPPADNNYPRNFAVRILKNGSQIYEKTDLTGRTWNKKVFDFEGLSGFEVSTTTKFEFELVAFNPLHRSDRNLEIWDLDEIKINGTCFSTNAPPPANEMLTYRVNAGGQEVIDGKLKWMNDDVNSPVSFFKGSAGVATSNVDAFNPTAAPDQVYESMKVGSELNYEFPVKNGTYMVNLYFRDNEGLAPGDRVFSGSLEGFEAFSGLDVGYIVNDGMLKKSFIVNVEDENLDLSLESEIGQAMISGIEITSLDGNTAPSVNIEVEAKDLVLYPNPVNNQLYVDFQIGDQDRTALIQVYDQSMRLVETKSVDLYSSGSKTALEMSNLSNGMYLIRVSTETFPKQMGRIIKE